MSSQGLNMCHSVSGHQLQLLLLILASALNFIEAEDEATAATEEFDGTLTPELCHNPNKAIRSMCCRLLLDDDVLHCMLLLQMNIPKNEERNPLVILKFMTSFTHCIYKSKKYVTINDKINMKVVKSDAKILNYYVPKTGDYLIRRYEHCQTQAELEWDKVRRSAAAKVLFKDAFKPFYMFVFLCAYSYGQTYCPHFVWQDDSYYFKQCEQMKKKCSALTLKVKN